MPPTVLITGAAGFIGRHVAGEAGRRGMDLRLMSHRRPLPDAVGEAAAGHRSPSGLSAQSAVPAGSVPRPPSVRSSPSAPVVRADLADPASLRGVCDGVDVLLHCAAQIGGTVEANEAVNARGTRALVAEARRAGVSRIVQVSTASVYGRGVFRRARPQDLVRNPESPTSASRAAGEDAVLAAGGIVLRPHFVHGPGDTWLVPGLVDVLRALPGTVEGWPARLSTVSVHDLARLAVGAGLAAPGQLTASVYHAADPEPVTAGELLRTVADCAGLGRPDRVLTVRQARELLAGERRLRHGLDMLTSDHWFDGEPLWSDLAERPGPGFTTAFARHAPWYGLALRPVRS